MKEQNPQSGSALTRRDFLKNTSVLAASAAAMMGAAGCATASKQGSPPAQFSDIPEPKAEAPKVVRTVPPGTKITAGIIGFGGRGGGAGKNFLDACNVVGVQGKILAVADLFPEKASRAADAYGVAADKCFSGFDAYQKLLAEKDINYVIIATPPGFRPPYFKAAVDAGKNIFTEKPVAVDGPGARMMLEAGQAAKQKGLKIAAGTQRRHSPAYQETIKRIQGGEIGDVMALTAYWVNGGPIWHRGVQGDTELEQQIRNWYHYIWLCGDHIAEQHVHNIDVCNWVHSNKHPVKCWGMGARQQLGDKPGEIWDNFAVEYEYDDGKRMYSYCGQIKREKSNVSEAVQCSKGMANPSGWIKSADGKMWRYRGEQVDPFMQEHVDLINAIVFDTELNETENVTNSTLTAIMGREAAYSGKEVEFEAMLNSTFKYGPEELYSNPASMKFGAFRTLKPPMPSEHDVFADPATVPVMKA